MTNFVLDPKTDVVASVPRSLRQYQRRKYQDKQYQGGEQGWNKGSEKSATVYIGNLSCYTNEYQLYELFTRCGSIKRIIMGLDRIKKMPCGFCFIEFDERASALKSIKYLHGTHLDGRDIQVDMDAGFQEGRQYGRGQSGGQIRDERRRDRESGGHNSSLNQGSGAILTRSITIVACLAMISLMFANSSEAAEISSDVRISPIGILPLGGYNPFLYPYANRYDGRNGRYININRVRMAQISKQHQQFEVDLANFLVNLMKSAKPTLMKAFIKATLADKQLKETAIGLFFGSGEEDSESSNDKDQSEEKDKDGDDTDGEKNKDASTEQKEKKKRKRGSKQDKDDE